MAERNDRTQTLSIVMIARNEAERIRESLRSALFADELIVVDTGSTDETASIAREEGAHVTTIPFAGFGRTKQKAIELATRDWVLSLDADEHITKGLRKQIQKVIQSPGAYSGFRVHRRGWFLGQPMKHGGWGHDEVIRLFKRGRGRFTPDNVHERITVDGMVGTLEGVLEHHTDISFPHFLAKLDKYTTLAAEELASRPHRVVGLLPAMIHSFGTLVKQLILQRGFLDGSRGILLAFSAAYSTLLRYSKAGMIRRGEGSVFVDRELEEVERQDGVA